MRPTPVGCATTTVLAAVSVSFAALLAQPALADPAPRVVQMLWSEDARAVVLVSNRGLIFADPETRRFELMCNDALALRVDDIPAVALLGDGRLLSAGTAGLKISSDRGCSWQGVTRFGDVQSPALAQHAAQRDTLYVATFGPGQSGIRVTRDGGNSFSDALVLADNEFTHSLAISPANPLRLYAAGIAFDATSRNHYLLRSSDGGQSWQRFAIELEASEERAALVTAHPLDQDEVLVKTIAFNPQSTPERLLLSRDGGKSFSTVFFGTLVSDASYAADAAEVWVADAAGLWRSTDRLESFAQHGSARWMSCVDHHDGRLWGCGQFAGTVAAKDGIGVSLKPGDPFFPWMDWKEVNQPIACDSSSPTALACQAAWAHWQVEVLGGSAGGAPNDAGAFGGAGGGGGFTGSGEGGAGADVGGLEARDVPAGVSGGCSAGNTGRAGRNALGALIVGALLALRVSVRCSGRGRQRRVAV